MAYEIANTSRQIEATKLTMEAALGKVTAIIFIYLFININWLL